MFWEGGGQNISNTLQVDADLQRFSMGASVQDLEYFSWLKNISKE